MIVERKQFGCVSVLLVQIGLALYVIVVFLSQNPLGGIEPQILKVQKVAEAKQTSNLTIAKPAENSLLTPQIEAKIIEAITNTVKSPNYSLLLISILALALILSQRSKQIYKRLLKNFQKLNLHTIGIIPRAPALA